MDGAAGDGRRNWYKGEGGETLGCQKQIIKLITTKTKYYVITQKLHIFSDLLSFIFFLLILHAIITLNIIILCVHTYTLL